MDLSDEWLAWFSMKESSACRYNGKELHMLFMELVSAIHELRGRLEALSKDFDDHRGDYPEAEITQELPSMGFSQVSDDDKTEDNTEEGRTTDD